MLGAHQVVLAGVARLLRGRGRLGVLLSVVKRDRVHGMAALDGLRAAERAARIGGINVGLVAERVREATRADIAASHSTGARRLNAGRSRPAWLLEFRRAGGPRRVRTPGGDGGGWPARALAAARVPDDHPVHMNQPRAAQGSVTRMVEGPSPERSRETFVRWMCNLALAMDLGPWTGRGTNEPRPSGGHYRLFARSS